METIIETHRGSETARRKDANQTLLLIEIGIVVAGELDSIDQRSLRDAVESLRSNLQRSHQSAGLTFRFVQVQRREMVLGTRVEPSVLLRRAQEERDAKGWDFAFVVTAAELLGKYSSSTCYAALSRPLDAAVFSTSLIDPHAIGEKIESSQRIKRLTERLHRLMLHAIGHLSGLSQTDANDRIMSRPTAIADLDTAASFSDTEQTKIQRALIETADQRLEEQNGDAGNELSFLMRAAWINRHEIAEAVRAARPWQFPLRLPGLTIASVSTLLILLMTAEAWDLALSQSTTSVIVLGILVAITTTIFVAIRQQLLIRRRRNRSEQNVVTALSAILIVAGGMATTWVCLAAAGMLVVTALFSSNLIAGWAASSDLDAVNVGLSSRWMMSCFCSSLGILIGALGASFESQNYFQHVIFVDEEL
ncbi:hypothetical protein LF1_37160 [Rubripirellula obstinata]|uniref:Uncharacterized protein n=1 Tax=Rubripirellula obstinata TaxID=406547 RepID=A0A5B1CLL4_9BACT|nr:hypothetical protein [Rubripirellula obstinata]KAA1261171.1 hypothetical protein LF1_37160 [Rubripirellula obstinata]